MQVTLRYWLDDEWLSTNAVKLGDSLLSDPIGYVTAEHPSGRGTRLRLDLHDVDEYKFRAEAIGWHDFVVVGYGRRVYLAGCQNRHPVIFVSLGSSSFDYFIEFHPLGNALLVVSGQGVSCLTPSGRLSWEAEVGVDGVQIDRVERGRIHGRACHDAPDIWKPFILSLHTGERLDKA